MKGSDLFVRCLENEGVEYIFGVPGEEVLDLLDSLSMSKIKFNRSFGVEFSNPDFVKLAESFGAKGVKIDRAKEFAPLLKKALEDGGIWVFDVQVDYSENMKLSWKLKGDVCKF